MDKLPAFDRKYTYLLKWCDKIEKKINQEFLDSPSSAIIKLNSIQEEIHCRMPEFTDAINMGRELLDDEELCHVSEKTASLESALSRIIDLHAKKLDTLRKITGCMEKLAENSEKLSYFLRSSEKSIELSLNIKELSYDDLEKELNNIQVLEKEIVTYDNDAVIIQNCLDELSSYKDDFNSTFKKNALQYSQSVLHRWSWFKKCIRKQTLSIQNVKNTWDQFFKALKVLEDWLTCKEAIASKVNYSDPGHSRSTYLEGVGVFENLNHCFKDDIRVLHAVNASFHNISKKEFNNCNSLKNRVLSANDRWHKLYKKVDDVFDAVKDILQIFDNFDQQKEHLLLFLTETDLKLTEMETTSPFQKNVYENIEENFKLHEDEKERYIATAKHLMKQSECSINAIQSSVDEVESYWEELYKRLQTLKKVHEHPTEKRKNIEQYSEHMLQSEDVKFDISKEETVKECEESDSFIGEKSMTQSQILKSFREEPKMFSETDSHEVKSQTYSTVVAMSTRKVDDTQITAEQISRKTILGRTGENESKIYSEKQSVTHSTRSKQKSFDDDCIKDLLAALKEAEERMNILENVLSELTPSGIDEQGPNYSHLLAACRSSVDVIQHLSQFLFYDVPNESDRAGKTKIKLQSEDLLQRWQKN